ncbi:hypothetical protein JOB18_030010 [Solea senegalensis]|uniref:Uncharacterized protein n=1 Tax=Solea senegalensis TaxID=28829 RepID=A0AAV6QWI4_SOLSE|nr:hypothetical protein JOB18_030010 [Solea senegalensis]
MRYTRQLPPARTALRVTLEVMFSGESRQKQQSEPRSGSIKCVKFNCLGAKNPGITPPYSTVVCGEVELLVSMQAPRVLESPTHITTPA